MRKMKLTVVAEFNIPDNVTIHDGGLFECEGVMFTPELNFDCVEADPDDEDALLNFPNDVWSVKEYEINFISLNANIDEENEDED